MMAGTAGTPMIFAACVPGESRMVPIDYDWGRPTKTHNAVRKFSNLAFRVNVRRRSQCVDRHDFDAWMIGERAALG
jgi:hypothetical protein